MLWWTYQQLRVSSLKTRLAVVEKLAQTENSDSVDPLIFALKDKESVVRIAAVNALGHRQSRQAVEPIMQLLRDPVPTVRMTAVEALGHIGDPVAVNWLVGLLRDLDPGVRSSVSRNLHRLGWQPGSDSQRVLQILAMGNLSHAAAMGPEAVEPLLQLMRSGPADKQFSAVKALGEINDPRICKIMVEALQKPSAGIRIVALGNLERLADSAAFPAVERMLKDNNNSVRGAAVEAVARCGGSRALPALLRALKDSSWEVRNATVKALGVLGDAAAVDGLCHVLRDNDRDVRESASISLGRIGSRRAINALILASLDVETVVRTAATTSLQVIDRHWELSEGIASILPQVKTALNSPDYWVRHSAIKLFERLRIDPESIQTAPAANAKGKSKEAQKQDVFSILCDLLFDRDRDMRLAAAEALGRLQDKNAVTILGAAVHDTDRLVKRAAQQALVLLGT
jgi:HEAT repeat protein